MTKSIEIPECHYPREAELIRPSAATPRHSLYLSNLDDQPFLRFSIRYLYLYRRAVDAELLKSSLARVLVDYYPLAGRLRARGGGTGGDVSAGKLEVDCNEQGALFAEGHLDVAAGKFLEGSGRPNRSWRKLLYRVDAQSFLDVPPLVIQAIRLSCGGMILCTAISHCLCDGIGTAQFLQSWAQIAAEPDAGGIPVAPFHGRHMLAPRSPPRIAFSHPEFNIPPPPPPDVLLLLLQSQPLVPVSVTFTPSRVLHLKRQCAPSLKCTSFEALASHVWRSWAGSLGLPPSLRVKLLFSTNVRRRLSPELPRGYYGNGFVLGCAEAPVGELLTSNPHYGVKLVQEAKERVRDGYVKSVVDLLEERRPAKPDLSASLVISQWSKLGLEELDFGEGKPLHMGPLASEIYCLLLPVVGDLHAFTVLMSVPQGSAEKFEHLLVGDSCEETIDGGGRRCYK